MAESRGRTSADVKAINVGEVESGAPLSLESPLLRPEQVADLLSVRRSWVYDAVTAGKLPCIRVGRHIRFTRTMVEDWLAEQI
jgi:excisionase family DNA binding protein